MQTSWTVRSVEEFWQAIKEWRPKKGEKLEAEHHSRKDARMTVYRLLEVAREVGLCPNWLGAREFKAALLRRIRELGLKRADLAATSGLSAETIKNIVADDHCPSAAPALRLAALVDERSPEREPLSLILTIAPATAGRVPSTRGIASVADVTQAAAPGLEPISPTSGGSSPVSDGSAPIDARSFCDDLDRGRRRWGDARRRAWDRTRVAGRRSFPSTVAQLPPESGAGHTASAPVVTGRRSQKPPTAAIDRTPSGLGDDGPPPRPATTSPRPSRRRPEPPSPSPRRTGANENLSQETPTTSPQRTEVDDRTDLQNIRTSPLVDPQPTGQPDLAMHVVKCRFPDGRLTTHEEASMAAVRAFLTRVFPGDAILEAQIQIDGRPFDPLGLVAYQRAQDAEARAAKAELRAEELERARTPGALSIFENLAMSALEEWEHRQNRREQRQQKKEKRRHGRRS
ncbi:MAG: hypothetical protein R3B09_26775 [Nannocystaceae bacterium]